MSLKEFEGKVVLVTGSSSGIGRTTAIHFAKLGASLVITGRNVDNLKKTEQQCSDSPKILSIPGDLTNQNYIKEIIDKTIKEFGKLDVLVNNAGIFEHGGMETNDLEQMDRIFATNLRAVYQLTKLAVPYLKQTQGNIINVSSVAGLRPFPEFLNYCISKSALDQLTQSLALELAPYKVRVNSVNPGLIETEIFDKQGLTKEQIKEVIKEYGPKQPLGRVGQPDDVARVITFLANEKSSFITGVLLPIDGGKSLTSSK